MTARAYALVLAAFCMGLFLAVVAANLIIDPQGLFHTGAIDHPNVNDRYRTLETYRAQPQQYDALLFGSSRSNAIPRDALTRRLKVERVADFSVVGGMMTDHTPALNFVLRDKAQRGERLRAVFLLLDIDSLGRRPYTNEDLQKLQPPALSGENPARFWWKNLTAIQFAAWRSALTAHVPPAKSSSVAPAVPRYALASTVPLGGTIATRAIRRIQLAQSPDVPAPRQPDKAQKERIVEAYHFREQIGLLRRFVELCRTHGVELVVATSPLSPALRGDYDERDIARAVDIVSRMTPVWDFTTMRVAAAETPDLWPDRAHFAETVARMMLARMFGEPMPADWQAFGRRSADRVPVGK